MREEACHGLYADSPSVAWLSIECLFFFVRSSSVIVVLFLNFEPMSFQAYPATLVLLAIIFFVSMIFETRSAETSRHGWKTSLLALVFPRLDREAVTNRDGIAGSALRPERGRWSRLMSNQKVRGLGSRTVHLHVS